MGEVTSYPSLLFFYSRVQFPEIPVSGFPLPGAVIPLPDPAFPDPLLFYLLILIVRLYLFLPLPFEVVDFSWGTSLADWDPDSPHNQSGSDMSVLVGHSG